MVTEILKPTRSSSALICVGILAMLLSGEIFYKTALLLTGGSVLIALTLAVVVEAGKFFLTVLSNDNTTLSKTNRYTYRGLKGIMVTFSIVASLFFFAQHLGDQSGMDTVITKTKVGIEQECARKANTLRQGLEGSKTQLADIESQLRTTDTKSSSYWRLFQDRKKAQNTLASDNHKLTQALLVLEQERTEKLRQAENPTNYAGDTRTRNQQLNGVITTLRSSGIPVSYHGVLLSLCALIAVCLEALIHVTAAIPSAILVQSKEQNTSALVKKPRKSRAKKAVVPANDNLPALVVSDAELNTIPQQETAVTSTKGISRKIGRGRSVVMAEM